MRIDFSRLFASGKEVKYENGVSTLTIPSATLNDAGHYVCEAENIHGTAQSNCVVTVTSSTESDQSEPKFTLLLTDITVQEQEEILLDCCVKGKPNPTVTWYKDGQKLAIENRMLQYTDRTGLARLNIMNTVPTDSGEYSCEAVNALGKDATECHVKVVGDSSSFSRSPSRSTSPSIGYASDDSCAPIITRPLVDTVVKIGCREMLELEVEGKPTPMIEWYHNGKLVSESRTIRSHFDGRVAFLKFYDAQLNHQGQYICKVGGFTSAECDIQT
ncbi:unnamed protein product [Strongylus vulgaris]|uniref:Ig-like domain-containing protein n=1 Tax=Strongylus vulgaris TaxID=40348 RepID=A0A3P7JDT0_STRVU|nr:unnamed protein product [Strongylus vulgaris]